MKSTSLNRSKSSPVKVVGDALDSAFPVVHQDNELVMACYRMTLTEKRLLLLGISKIDYSKYPSRSEPLEFDITVGEWKSAYSDSSRSIYKDIEAASKRLIGRQVFIKGRSDSDQVLNWLDRCVYHRGEGRISIRFGWSICHYLAGFVDQFTRLNIMHIRALSSFHSIRLYELLIQFRATGFRAIKIEEFRTLLGIDNAYPRFADLKRRIIVPSVNELNKNTDISISWTEVKEGKKVVSLRFIFEEKRQGNLLLD